MGQKKFQLPEREPITLWARYGLALRALAMVGGPPPLANPGSAALNLI